MGLHVGEVAEHLRCGDDAGDGDSLMAIDITVHTGEIEERSRRLPMSRSRISPNETASFLPMERRLSQLAGMA